MISSGCQGSVAAESRERLWKIVIGWKHGESAASTRLIISLPLVLVLFPFSFTLFIPIEVVSGDMQRAGRSFMSPALTFQLEARDASNWSVRIAPERGSEHIRYITVIFVLYEL